MISRFAIFAAAIFASSALAADYTPALIYDLGGKYDKSFNEAAHNGAERFTEETGVAYRDFEIQNDAQREQAIRRFAKKGYNPIVVTGFSYASVLEKVAPDFPDTNFAIIDSAVDAPNVRSLLFKEQEGSWLVGILAAMKAKEMGGSTVGFVGGMDIPLIRAFACGYRGGVATVTGDIQVIENMTGSTGAAWNDPVKGAELTRSQIGRGAQVVFHAAGGTGVGVLQAAAEEGKFGIGVDSNQNGLQPGHVLTSMVKRVDNAVFETFMDGKEGAFEPGVARFGLAENGVGWALDENNDKLVSQAMRDAVTEAAAKIASGEIQVHDYRSNDECPY